MYGCPLNMGGMISYLSCWRDLLGSCLYITKLSSLTFLEKESMMFVRFYPIFSDKFMIDILKIIILKEMLYSAHLF